MPRLSVILWRARAADAIRHDPVPLVLRAGVLFAMVSIAFWVPGDLDAGRGPSEIVPELALVGLLGALLLRGVLRVATAVALGTGLLVAHLLVDDTKSNISFYAILAIAFLTLFLAYTRRLVWVGLWATTAVAWSVRNELVRPGFAGMTLQFIVPLIVFMGGLGWGMSVVMARRRQAEAEVARLAERRRAERVQLARELHDSVARDLTIITMQSAVLRSTTDPQDQEIARNAIEETARSGLDSLKRLLVVLRAGDAVDAPAFVRDLEADSIRLAAAEVSRHLALLGYQITVGPLPEDLPKAAETTAVRVVREAATNITKHAPPTALCSIDVVREGAAVVVRVTNDLPTAAEHRVPSTRLGLDSLAERLRLLGGTLDAGPVGDRWVVTATIPTEPPLAGTIRS